MNEHGYADLPIDTQLSGMVQIAMKKAVIRRTTIAPELDAGHDVEAPDRGVQIR